MNTVFAFVQTYFETASFFHKWMTQLSENQPFTLSSKNQRFLGSKLVSVARVVTSSER